MNRKALFFDIDGTLVSFKTHVIPSSTVAALQEAHDHGTGVYIATGRPVGFINNLGQIKHLIDGWLTTNGAYCFIGDKVVCKHVFLKHDVDTVLDYCATHDVPAIVVGEHHIGAFNMKPEIVEVFGKGLGVGPDLLSPIEQVLEESVLQISPFVSPEQEAELMPLLESANSGRWTPSFADLTPGGADKGTGLEAMAKALGISLADTIAFGDGGNDLALIRKAGIGIAMGNANQVLLDAADYITTSVDDDGVMNGLRHFGVIE